MQFEALAQALAPNEIVNAEAVEIADLAHDTRAVKPGALFFCVRGSRSDGHDLAGEAVGRGAAALVVDRALDVTVPQLVVAPAPRAVPPPRGPGGGGGDGPCRRCVLPRSEPRALGRSRDRHRGEDDDDV